MVQGWVESRSIRDFKLIAVLVNDVKATQMTCIMYLVQYSAGAM